MQYDGLITIYISRFVNRRDIWGKQYITYDGLCQYACQKPDMDSKGGKYLYEPLTPGLIKRHLQGEITCALAAIDENYCSKWLCFDSDLADGSLDKLEAALKSWGVHVIREGRRPGRDGHLWVLFDQPIKANLLVSLSDTMMRLAGVDYIERFPKSFIGLSQVRAPLGINLKPEAKNARGWFEGVEQNIIAQLEWLAVQPLNRAEDAIREAERFKNLVSKPIRSLSLCNQYKSIYRHPAINILDYVDYRQSGGEFVAQCPLCAGAGHDRHRDNLRIKPDGSIFCCVYGGPGQVHKAPDIIKSLLLRRKSA